MFIYSDIAPKCGRDGCDNNSKLNKPTRIGIYNRFCSAKCSANSLSTRKKREDSCTEKYGGITPLLNKEIKDKALNVMIERYGVEYPLQSEEFRKQVRETNLEKYGVENPAMSSSIMEKIGNTNLEKYGTVCSLHNKDVNRKAKDTMIERYGVEYAVQNIEIFIDQQRGKWKEYKLPSGNIIKIQGYENTALDILLETHPENDILVNYDVPAIWYNYEHKKKRYIPDIFIKSENLIIEVKSEYTFNKDITKNKAKEIGCITAGYNFEFWIFNNKRERIIK